MYETFCITLVNILVYTPHNETNGWLLSRNIINVDKERLRPTSVVDGYFLLCATFFSNVKNSEILL